MITIAIAIAIRLVHCPRGFAPLRATRVVTDTDSPIDTTAAHRSHRSLRPLVRDA